MKILLTGSSGLLGNAYAEAALRRGHQLIAHYNSNEPKLEGLSQKVSIPGTELDLFTALCLAEWPDAIINCAAISSPEKVEEDPALAEKMNVALPRHLAQIATHLGARFIHVSTDMVFDGLSETPYRSTDMPNPGTLYGQTKLMAEREVLEHNPEDPVVLRVPILMGKSPGGKRSVHEKLLAAVQAGEKPKLFTDEIRQPCSATNVADLMLELTERRDLHGIFHWAGRQTISRYEMCRRILAHLGLSEDLIEAATKDDDPAFASRPSSLTFNLHPLAGKVKTRPVDFDEQLEEITRVEPFRG